MKIGISCEFVGTKQAGTATYSQNLLRGLAEYGAGHQYVPYLADAAGLKLVPQVAHLNPKVVGPYAAALRLTCTLPWELVRHPVDLLHAQGWGPVWSPVPMILTVHDVGFERFPQIYPKLMALRLSWLVRSSAQRALLILASSQATANDLIELYQIPAAKIRVVYPAANPEIRRVEQASELARVRAAYQLSRPYLLYVGSIEPKKNVHRLIEAYAALCRQREVSHDLVIAGKALWLSEPVLRLPTALGVAERVRFIGQVPHADLAPLYSAADGFAFLGMYEGFGYPPLEAMTCGTPVLVARRTSLPEVVGQAALLVDPDDLTAVVQGLDQLLYHQPLRAQLRERGFEQIQQFQVATHVRQVVAAYEACGHQIRQSAVGIGSQRGEG